MDADSDRTGNYLKLYDPKDNGRQSGYLPCWNVGRIGPTWTHVDAEYDKLGRVRHVSEPHCAGERQCAAG